VQIYVISVYSSTELKLLAFTISFKVERQLDLRPRTAAFEARSRPDTFKTETNKNVFSDQEQVLRLRNCPHSKQFLRHKVQVDATKSFD